MGGTGPYGNPSAGINLYLNGFFSQQECIRGDKRIRLDVQNQRPWPRTGEAEHCNSWEAAVCRSCSATSADFAIKISSCCCPRQLLALPKDIPGA